MPAKPSSCYVSQGKSCISQSPGRLICRRSRTRFAMPAKCSGLVVGLKNIKLPWESTSTLERSMEFICNIFLSFGEWAEGQAVTVPGQILHRSSTSLKVGHGNERKGVHLSFLRLEVGNYCCFLRVQGPWTPEWPWAPWCMAAAKGASVLNEGMTGNVKSCSLFRLLWSPFAWPQLHLRLWFTPTL